MQEKYYKSKQTSKVWNINNSIYYDCHIVTVAQILPLYLYQGFLTICSIPKIRNDWQGLVCRNLLDSESKRDVVLLDKLGVSKHLVPINRDIEGRIKNTIKKAGYCIVRVDSYYHEHFTEYYMQEHRTNGHKVVVIDWDDTHFYGIDNVGQFTLVLDFKKDLFLEAIYSNLFHVYEKEDTLYYLELEESYEKKTSEKILERLVEESLDAFINERLKITARMDCFFKEFSYDMMNGTDIRKYAQAKNSYTSAFFIETSYMVLIETFSTFKNIWLKLNPNSEKFIDSLEQTIKSWRMLKMLCKTYESSKNIDSSQLITALKRVVEDEKNMSALLK